MYCRSVIFTDAPLIKAIRYRNVFQLVPFFYFPNAPFSKYVSHFPCYLEYEVEDKDEILPTEDEFRKRGISEDVLRLGRKIPNQTRARKEILHLLTSLTNIRLFEYFAGNNCWGIQAPMKDVNELSADELKELNAQTSHWTIRGYIYPHCADDFKITDFTECKEYKFGRTAMILRHKINDFLPLGEPPLVLCHSERISVSESGSYAPSLVPIMIVPLSNTSTVCHWPSGILRATQSLFGAKSITSVTSPASL